MYDPDSYPPETDRRSDGVAFACVVAAVAIIVLTVLALIGRARAADVTPAERAACIGDVRRFCPDELARRDVEAGIACLQRNRERLSAPCRKVLADRGL